MPRPIPEWDQFRVLLNYLLRKQLDYQRVTLQQLTQRMGIGVKTVEDLLMRNGVVYTLLPTTEKWKNSGVEIVIESIPAAYETIFKVEGQKILETFNYFTSREIELEPEPDRQAIRKEQRRQKKIEQMRYFLKEEQEQA